MNPTRTLLLAWCGALAILIGTHPTRSQAGPNVLLIIADDLNNSLGCYGHPVVRSPNIDELARQGLRFDRAYCQYPVCNPSRSSLLTGLRPSSTRVLDNTVFFRKTVPNVVTLPELFRSAGYYTASVGKIFHDGGRMPDDPRSWDEIHHPKGTDLGKRGEGRDLSGGQLTWCRWLAAEGSDEDQADGLVAREAVRILGEKADQPFFLAVGFHKPHDPFISPKKYFDPYILDNLHPPEVPADRPADPPFALPKDMKRVFDTFTDRERREFMRSYYAGVSFTDAQIARVLAELDRRKLRENTVIVFLGDHGYHVGERGWWNKNTVFEMSARAPLIVSSPGMKARGRSCNRLVEFVDIYPTIADLCGLELPPGLEGRSFRPLLDDPDGPGKAAAYTQVQRGPVAGYSVRTDRWRYTEWDDGHRSRELHDHANDPGEWRNLAADPAHKATLDELRALVQHQWPARGQASP